MRWLSRSAFIWSMDMVPPEGPTEGRDPEDDPSPETPVEEEAPEGSRVVLSGRMTARPPDLWDRDGGHPGQEERKREALGSKQHTGGGVGGAHKKHRQERTEKESNTDILHARKGGGNAQTITNTSKEADKKRREEGRATLWPPHALLPRRPSG